MSNKAVIGLGFGDEGKGVVTEYLSSQDPSNTIVTRFSGGQQAGHKVCKGDVEHIFSNFGAGTLSGCPTFWSQYCTFDPVCFWNEYKILNNQGIKPKIYIHPQCAVTTHYDVLANRVSSAEIKHGTTGTGFFQTKKRHEKIKLTAHGMFCSACSAMSVGGFGDKLNKIRNYYGFSDDQVDEDIYLDAVSCVRHLEWCGIIEITDRVPDYKHTIYEGSQGLMLDQFIGHMPHCTPSDVTPRHAIDLAGYLDELFLVTRCYQTRHGNGPMTNSDKPVKLCNTEKETNVFNEYQGEFRTTVLDLDQLVHAYREGVVKFLPAIGKVNLVVTCVDQVNKLKATEGNVVHIYNDAANFARLIGAKLDIDGDVYINDSPYSHTIKGVADGKGR